MTCQERIEAYLTDHGVAFEARRHRQLFTAQEVAASEHIPGRQLAKVVMLLADDHPVMLVVPASYRVDVPLAGVMLGAGLVRLAHEAEFKVLFPDCEPGAMPPFGNLYGIPVYVDHVLAMNETIVCQVGTHTDTLSLRYTDWQRLVQPVVGTFAYLPRIPDDVIWDDEVDYREHRPAAQGAF